MPSQLLSSKGNVSFHNLFSLKRKTIFMELFPSLLSFLSQLSLIHVIKIGDVGFISPSSVLQEDLFLKNY